MSTAMECAKVTELADTGGVRENVHADERAETDHQVGAYRHRPAGRVGQMRRRGPEWIVAVAWMRVALRSATLTVARSHTTPPEPSHGGHQGEGGLTFAPSGSL